MRRRSLRSERRSATDRNKGWRTAIVDVVSSRRRASTASRKAESPTPRSAAADSSKRAITRGVGGDEGNGQTTLGAQLVQVDGKGGLEVVAHRKWRTEWADAGDLPFVESTGRLHEGERVPPRCFHQPPSQRRARCRRSGSTSAVSHRQGQGPPSSMRGGPATRGSTLASDRPAKTMQSRSLAIRRAAKSRAKTRTGLQPLDIVDHRARSASAWLPQQAEPDRLRPQPAGLRPAGPPPKRAQRPVPSVASGVAGERTREGDGTTR